EKNREHRAAFSQTVETKWTTKTESSAPHPYGKKGLSKLAHIIQQTRTSRPENRQTLDYALEGLRQIQKNDIKKEGTFWSRHKGKIIFGLTAFTLTLAV